MLITLLHLLGLFFVGLALGDPGGSTAPQSRRPRWWGLAAALCFGLAVIFFLFKFNPVW